MQKAILPAKCQPFEYPNTLVFAKLSFFFYQPRGSNPGRHAKIFLLQPGIEPASPAR
jgi:hypothetical protein